MFRILYLIATMLVFSAPPSRALSPEVQADLLLIQAIEAIEEGDYSAAMRYFDALSALEVPKPEAFLFHYGKTALKARQFETSMTMLESYINAVGSSGEFYQSALGLYLNAQKQMQSEKERQIAEAQRHAEEEERQAIEVGIANLKRELDILVRQQGITNKFTEWDDACHKNAPTVSTAEKPRYYVGELTEDCAYRDGLGTYYWMDLGRIYVGQFRNGKRHGYGIQASVSGQRHTGMWKNGKKHGSGSIRFTSGKTCTGLWRDGHMIGEGTAGGNTSSTRCFSSADGRYQFK